MEKIKRLLLMFLLATATVSCGGSSSDPDKEKNNLQQNRAPSSNASSDQNVTKGATVVLDGTASSDADGDSLSYTWSFTSMPPNSTANLTNPNSSTTTFIADLSGTYVLQLIVNDGTTNSSADYVTVTVTENINTAPVANAGSDQNVSVGALIKLNGSNSSDADGDLLSFLWSFASKPNGSNATLDDETAISPSFLTDISGNYALQLIVNDGTENSVVDAVVINATTGNSAPVANAGSDQNVVTGSLVRLDGSASTDADGDNLSYLWSFAVGKGDPNTATLNNPTSVSPSFIANESSVYAVTLVVNDGTQNSTSDLVLITATANNTNPVAKAGNDQNATVGSVINLDGTASVDADGDTLTYHWSFSAKPSQSSAALNDTNVASPHFTVDAEGIYVLQLIVNDGTENSEADSVTITASYTNAAPTADAGNNQNVKTGTLIYLDGSGSSDANNDALFYKWSFVSKPSDSHAFLDDPTLVTPSFTADVDGDYIVSLTVNDGLLNSDADTVTISASEGRAQLFLQNSEGTYVEIDFSSPKTLITQLDNAATTRSLGTYKLVAQSSNLTISNLHASEKNALVTPYFVDLADNIELNQNEEFVFSLVTPLLKDTPLNLSFGFDIVETGDAFIAEFDIVPLNTGDDQPTPIVRIEPKYPIEAARNGIEGWVKLSFTVNEVGSVEDIEILASEPEGVFEREAQRALAKWKYKPQIVDGKPVKQPGLTVVLVFKIET